MILLAKIITCASYHAERQDFPLYFQNNSAELEQFPSIWCELHALIITLPVIWLLAACLCALGTLSVSCSCPFSCYAFFLFSLLPLFSCSTITYNLSSEQVHLWLNSDPPFTSITSAGRGGEVKERVNQAYISSIYCHKDWRGKRDGLGYLASWGKKKKNRHQRKEFQKH